MLRAAALTREQSAELTTNQRSIAMCDSDKLAAIIAAAIHANGGKRLTQAQAQALVGQILGEKLAEGCTHQATVAPLINLSQFNQETERCGNCTTDRGIPALQTKITAELIKRGTPVPSVMFRSKNSK